MSQPSIQSRSSSTLVLQCAFIALAVVTRNLMFLSVAFALCGVAVYRSQLNQTAKTFALLSCIVLTIAPIGYQLGKDMGVRDNAINTAMQATKA